MKPVFLAFIFLFLSYQASTQSKEFRGLIREAGSLAPVLQATVSCESNQRVAYSNGLGQFVIQAVIGDTLKITKPGFMDQFIILSSGNDVIIHLAKAVQLAEVRVTGQSKKEELDEIKKQYRKKGSYFAGKPPVLSYIFSPLTAIYELIGKTPGQARRFNNYYSRELEQSEVDRRFSMYRIQPLTAYQDLDLQNFMSIYRPSFEDLAGWADYDLVKYIRTSALAFEAAGRPTALSLPKLPKAPDLSEKILKY
jgi:hypothetical protein